MRTRDKIILYIKANRGMPASVAKIRDAIGLDITYPSIHSQIASLKKQGIIWEEKGRYYA